jgi:glycosyltransferase involved in cell wall biosynthesis
MRKNICHIISGDIWAGAEAQLFSTVIKLSTVQSLDICVLVFNKGVLYDKLNERNIKVKLISEKQSIFSIIFHIYMYLRKEKIDIVHSHGFKETLLGGFAFKLYGRGSIVRTIHGKGMLGGSLKYRIIEFINKMIFTDHYIAVSHELSNYLIKQNFPVEKITVIHNGLNHGDIQIHNDSSQMKSILGISSDKVLIGTLGRLVPVKGQRYFIECARMIIKSVNNVMFVIGGDGPLRHELEMCAKEYGISDKLIFTGFVEKPYDFINMLDIFLLTSLHEGIPMVILEAMFLRKAIISTSVGGIPEILVNNHNALLVPSRDSKAMSKLCIELINNEEKRANLANNAYMDLMGKHLVIHGVTNILRIYQSIIKNQ